MERKGSITAISLQDSAEAIATGMDEYRADARTESIKNIDKDRGNVHQVRHRGSAAEDHSNHRDSNECNATRRDNESVRSSCC